MMQEGTGVEVGINELRDALANLAGEGLVRTLGMRSVVII